MLAISRLLTYLHFCNHGNVWKCITLISCYGASAYTAYLFVCVWGGVCVHNIHIISLCGVYSQLDSSARHCSVYFCQEYDVWSERAYFEVTQYHSSLDLWANVSFPPSLWKNGERPNEGKKKLINILWGLKPQGTHILSFLSLNTVYKWISFGELRDVRRMKLFQTSQHTAIITAVCCDSRFCAYLNSGSQKNTQRKTSRKMAAVVKYLTHHVIIMLPQRLSPVSKQWLMSAFKII